MQFCILEDNRDIVSDCCATAGAVINSLQFKHLVPGEGITRVTVILGLQK